MVSKGAYTIRDLKTIVQKTFTDYLENPAIPYSVHFTFNFATSNREISPAKLQKLSALKNAFSKKITQDGNVYNANKIDLLRQILKST